MNFIDISSGGDEPSRRRSYQRQAEPLVSLGILRQLDPAFAEESWFNRQIAAHEEKSLKSIIDQLIRHEKENSEFADFLVRMERKELSTSLQTKIQLARKDLDAAQPILNDDNFDHQSHLGDVVNALLKAPMDRTPLPPRKLEL